MTEAPWVRELRLREALYAYLNHEPCTGHSLEQKWSTLRAVRETNVAAQSCPAERLVVDYHPEPLRTCCATESVPATILRRLIPIVEEAKLPNDVFLLAHGSIATGIMTPFSDIDLVAVIPERIMNRGEMETLRQALEPIRRFLYRHDPLAHHGIMIISPGHERHYSEFMLPSASLQLAISLSRDRFRLEFNVCKRCSIAQARHYLARYIGEMEHVADDPPVTPYAVKYVLAHILLCPSIALEALRGQFPYKRESFELCRAFLSEKALRALEECSSLRQGWRIPRTYLWMARFAATATGRGDLGARTAARMARMMSLWDMPQAGLRLSTAASILAIELRRLIAESDSETILDVRNGRPT